MVFNLYFNKLFIFCIIDELLIEALIMKNHTFFLICFFQLMLNLGYGQENALLEWADTLKYNNPEAAIKIGEYQLKNMTDNNNKALAHILVAESYISEGNYTKAVKNIFSIHDSVYLKKGVSARVELVKADLLRKLFLNEQARNHLKKADTYVTESDRERSVLIDEITLEEIALDFNEHPDDTGLKRLENLQNDLPKKVPINRTIQRKILELRAKILERTGMSTEARNVYDKVLKLVTRYDAYNYYALAQSYNKRGETFIDREQYDRAEIDLKKALGYAKILNNDIFLRTIYQNLTITSLALDDQKAHTAYNKNLQEYMRRVENKEQEAINALFSLINKTQRAEQKSVIGKWRNYRSIAWTGFVLLMFLCLGLLGRSFWQKKRYREILNFLEVGKNIRAVKKQPQSPKGRGIVISEEREKLLLKKLKHFENSTKFTSQEMSLAVLAGHLDTNTKYLSEIIKRHYHDNFSTFINKLRIQFIIKKLETDLNYRHYKISYLAEKSGFSTHSSFSTVFKSIVGISPGKFIDLLKKENHQSGETT